jgi:hypothetical protein
MYTLKKTIMVLKKEIKYGEFFENFFDWSKYNEESDFNDFNKFI